MQEDYNPLPSENNVEVKDCPQKSYLQPQWIIFRL